MHQLDLLYGSVLTTGEIAYYMSLPKNKKPNPKTKSDFLQSWLSKRIKKQTDIPALRKYLKALRKKKNFLSAWLAAMRFYETHIDALRANKGKSDRTLLHEGLAQLADEQFCVKTYIEKDEIDYSQGSDAQRAKFIGTVVLMNSEDAKFDANDKLINGPIKLIVHGPYAGMRAMQIFGLKSFPILTTNRNDILCLGSAEQHIEEVNKFMTFK